MVTAIFQNLLRLKVKGQGRNTKKMNGTFVHIVENLIILKLHYCLHEFDVPNNLPTK